MERGFRFFGIDGGLGSSFLVVGCGRRGMLCYASRLWFSHLGMRFIVEGELWILREREREREYSGWVDVEVSREGGREGGKG